MRSVLARWNIITLARSLVGVPFLHQGRSLKGLDCVGVLVYIAKELGIATVDYTQYSREPDGKILQEKLNTYLHRKIIIDFSPGDILLMIDTKMPCHVAVYTDKGTIIHANSKLGKVVEHRLSEDWRRKIRGVYTFPGVT